MSLAYSVVTGAFVMVAVFMLLLILVQRRSRLSSIFGEGGGHSVGGVHTPAAITWMTAGTFALFLTLAVLLNWLA